MGNWDCLGIQMRMCCFMLLWMHCLVRLHLGDIGKHFPDSDPAYSGISSVVLLSHVKKLIDSSGYEVGNIDATIIAQKPKMAPHIPEMIRNVAETLEIPVSCVNIKATTEEGLGFTGRGEGIAAQAVCLLNNKMEERES